MISDATRLLVGNLFECRELALAELKGRRGLSAPGSCWGKRHRQPLRGVAPRPVCRSSTATEELELLLRRWEQAKAGEGRVCLDDWGAGHWQIPLGRGAGTICGVSPPSAAFAFFCSPHHLDTPLYPIIRHIERAAKFQRGRLCRRRNGTSLTACFPRAPLAKTRPLLADLLSIQYPGVGLPQDGDAATAQVDDLCGHHASDRASWRGNSRLLAILEDMHWADPTTLELLNLLVESVQQLPCFWSSRRVPRCARRGRLVRMSRSSC